MNTLQKTQIPALALMLTFVILITPLFVSKVHSQTLPTTSTLDASADIFVSPSTTNGDRRMLFVGTYTDSTVCGIEGCPPVYSESVSYLNFNLPSLPDDTIITNAKLQLYHYGSNAEFSLRVAETTSSWNESTNSVYPIYSGTLGAADIPEFNTANSNEIQLREINIDLANFNGTNFTNGFALLPSGNLNTPGVVFCSKDSDGFCQPQHQPKLVLTTQPNLAPRTPNLTLPTNNQIISGNCDWSNQTGECAIEKTINFSANNIGDTDPGNGALDYSIFRIAKDGATFLDSHHLSESDVINYATELEDGVYSVKTISYDKRQISSESNPATMTIDTTPPSQPNINPLASVTRPSNNLVGVNVLANPSTDNISSLETIQYQLQYSTDSSFLSNTGSTNWQQSPSFNLNQSQLSPDQRYYFRIKAKDAANNISDWSDTAATNLEGLPLTPTWNKNNWGINDGVKADGIYPELGRLNPNYVIRGKEINLMGRAEQGKSVQIFINNSLMATVPVSNESCAPANNRTVCNFYYKFTFPTIGANNANGVPINYFSFQFRTIDELDNASLLSAKETIYHDNTPPRIVVLNNSVPLTTNQTNVSLNLTGEKFADVGYKIFKQTNGQWKLVNSFINKINAIRNLLDIINLGSSSRDDSVKNCISNINEKSSGICSDGQYRVEITIYDSPGNKSVSKSFTIERDTVSPQITKFEAFQCESKICANVEGEINSSIEINGVNYGNLDNGTKQIIISNTWKYNTNYVFKLNLKDPAGNQSQVKQSSFYTPLITNGGLGVYPEANLGPQKISNRTIDDQILIEVEINVSKRSFEVKNVKIPAPILEDFYTDYDESIKIYGVTVPKHRKIKIKVLKRFSTYGEAHKTCYIDRWNIIEWKPSCIEKEMGYSNVLDLNLNCWYGQCYLNGKVEVSEFEVDAKEMKANFYKNDESNTFMDYYVLDSGKLEVLTKLNNPLGVGDRVSSRIEIAGSFDVDGNKFSFDGRQSERSNQLTIEKSAYINLDGKPAKRLDVKYFNQFIDEKGNPFIPPTGNLMCGAASAVMISGYFTKLPNQGYSTNLKDYVYKDEGQGLKKGDKVSNLTLCMDGAFGMTGASSNCSSNLYTNIITYLSRQNLYYKYQSSEFFTLEKMALLKSEIDSGDPVIFSYNWNTGGFSHIAVVKGYTIDENQQINGLIFNDPYRNTFTSPPTKNIMAFSSSGENAVYPLSYDTQKKVFNAEGGWVPFYFLYKIN